jgi:hypothetical protein
LLAHVHEGVREPVADMVAHRARDADAAWLGQPLQAHRDVDAVAIDVAAVGDHVAEIDPDAKAQAALLGEIQITVDHRALDLAGTAHRVDDAGEFCQHAVAGGLDDPAVMLADLRINEFEEMRLEPFVRALLVHAHQARIAHHIGREDRGETTGGSRSGHCSDGAHSRAEFNLFRAAIRQFRAGSRRGMGLRPSTGVVFRAAPS